MKLNDIKIWSTSLGRGRGNQQKNFLKYLILKWSLQTKSREIFKYLA